MIKNNFLSYKNVYTIKLMDFFLDKSRDKLRYSPFCYITLYLRVKCLLSFFYLAESTQSVHNYCIGGFRCKTKKKLF